MRQGIAEPGGQAGVEVIDVEAGGLHEANYAVYVRNYGIDSQNADTGDKSVHSASLRPMEKFDAVLRVYGHTGLVNRFTLPLAVEGNYDNILLPNTTKTAPQLAMEGNYTSAAEMARIMCFNVKRDGSGQMHDCGRYFSYWAAFNAKKASACPPVDETCEGKSPGWHCSTTIEGGYYYCGGGDARVWNQGLATMKMCAPRVSGGMNYTGKCYPIKEKLSGDGCSVEKATVADIQCNTDPAVDESDVDKQRFDTVCQSAEAPGLTAATSGLGGCTVGRKCAKSWYLNGQQLTGCSRKHRQGTIYHTPVCMYEEKDDVINICNSKTARKLGFACKVLPKWWKHFRCVMPGEDGAVTCPGFNWVRRQWGVCGARCRKTVDKYTGRARRKDFVIDGANTNTKCHFPFTYKGKSYYDCAMDPAGGGDWCATSPMFKRHQYNCGWKYKRIPVRAKCVFPFKTKPRYWWQGYTTWRKCAPGRKIGKKGGKWCAIKVDADGDVPWNGWAKCRGNGPMSRKVVSWKWVRTGKRKKCRGYGWGRCAPAGADN